MLLAFKGSCLFTSYTLTKCSNSPKHISMVCQNIMHAQGQNNREVPVMYTGLRLHSSLLLYCSNVS